MNKFKLTAINPAAVSEEERKTILSNSIAANEELAVEAQDKALAIMGKAKKENGMLDLKSVEGYEGDVYADLQKYQAVIAEVQQINNAKLETAQFESSVSTPIVSTPALTAQRNAQRGTFKGVMDTFEQAYGLKDYNVTDKKTHKIPKASAFDILENYTQAKVLANSIIYNAALPGVTRTGGAGTSSTTGVAVDRYRSEIPALMALNLRDYFTPLLPRMAFQPDTDSLRFLVEPDNAGNPVNNRKWDNSGRQTGDTGYQAAEAGYNKVSGQGEGDRAYIQGIATREIIVTAVKRMVYASMTSEQATDTVQARQILNDVVVRNVMEDLEYQSLYGNGTAPNLNGILTHSGIQTGTLTAANNLTAIEFLLAQLKEFVKKRGTGAGKRPTHLVMPPANKIGVMETTDADGRYLWANTVQGDFMSVWGIPIVVSDHVTDDTGFYINIADVALVIKSGVEMDMGIVNDDFIRDQTSIRFKHRCNVLVKREKSIRTLTGLNHALSKPHSA